MSPWDRRAALRLVATLVGGGLAGCSSGGSDATPVGRAGVDPGGWPTFGHDAGNTGHADDDGPTAYGNTVWTRSIGAVHDGPRTPGGVVAGGRAFVPAADTLAAVSLDDGSVEWARSGGSRATPAVADGTCYRLVAGDRTRVEALDAASGERRWQRDLPARHHRAGLAVGESTLYVTGTNRTVRCLDRDSGEPVWAAGDATGIGPPALGDGRLFVTTDGGVVARDARTGERRWRRGLFAYDAPAFDGERVVVGTRDAVRAFGADGTPRWSADLGGPVRGTPALAGDTVVAATRAGLVNGFDPDGTRRWQTTVSGEVTAPVAVAGGVVYVPTRNGGLVALSLADGATRWRAELDGGLAAPPAVADGRLLAVDAGSRASLLRSLEGGLSFPDVGSWRRPAGTPTGTSRAPGTTLPDDPSVDWQRPRSRNQGTLLVGRGRLFAATAGGIVARSAASGRLDWQYTDVDPGEFPSVLALGAGGVYAGIGEELRCLAPGGTPEERVRWTVNLPTGGLVTSATEVDGTVYATGAGPAEVAAVDPADGTLLWTFSQGTELAYTPAVTDDLVHVGARQGEVFSVDRRDGTLVGTALSGGQGQGFAVADGHGYTVTVKESVRSVPLPDATGPRWQTRVDGSVTAPLALGPRRAFVVSETGRVVALDRRDGTRAVDRSLSLELTAAPRLVDGALLVAGRDGDTGAVVALSAADLRERWRASVFDGPRFRRTGTGRVASVVPAGGRLFVLGSGLAALS